MTGQVIFKIDKKLKEQALHKAHAQGLPFASILKLATRAYVEGRLAVDVIEAAPFNPASRKQITAALSDIRQKKNLSPRFSSAREAMKYLKA